MAEKMSWDEIKRTYPDEFVAIVDPEHDAEDCLTGGTLVGHGRSKVTRTASAIIRPGIPSTSIRRVVELVDFMVPGFRRETA
ncbi:MAG: hypothetical protein HY815_06700 [Candidatus Riflebacteria bacterium]|nr:hypothetical protein [Candidatus Riflebacteria bacterium]